METRTLPVWAIFGNVSGLNTASHAARRFKMQAVGDIGEDDRIHRRLPHPEVARSPRENVTISTPFASIVDGEVTIVPPSGPDLRGYLVDAPAYIKKAKDGHLEFDDHHGDRDRHRDRRRGFQVEESSAVGRPSMDIRDDIAPERTSPTT